MDGKLCQLYIAKDMVVHGVVCRVATGLGPDVVSLQGTEPLLPHLAQVAMTVVNNSSKGYQ